MELSWRVEVFSGKDMTSCVFPKPLDDIEIRRIWRQKYEIDSEFRRFILYSLAMLLTGVVKDDGTWRPGNRSDFENGIDSPVVIGMNQAVNEVSAASLDYSYPFATQAGFRHFGHKGSTTFANYAGESCFVFLFETDIRLFTIFDGEQCRIDKVKNKVFIYQRCLPSFIDRELSHFAQILCVLPIKAIVMVCESDTFEILSSFRSNGIRIFLDGEWGVDTNRLTLRRWRDDDAEALYKYASDGRVSEMALWPRHTSVDMSRKVIQDFFQPNPFTLAMVLKETDEPIGCIGLVPRGEEHYKPQANEREVGYWIGFPYWGQRADNRSVGILD